MNPSTRAKLVRLKHVVLDMDGTIYRGGTLFACTRPFLAQLRVRGLGYTFLTNNSSRSSRDYLAHLAHLEIATSPSQLYTSTNATVEWFRVHQPRTRRLFGLCTPSLAGELQASGFALTRDDSADEPDAVLVAFDTTLDYARLCRAAFWISRGKPFIATHPDRLCPTDDLTVLVDCGSICAALEKATGRPPDRVLGKPDPAMLAGIRQQHGLAATEIAMVGDRIYTDLAMARAAGCIGVLVLSGETTRAEAEGLTPGPDLIVNDIGELGQMLEVAHAQT